MSADHRHSGHAAEAAAERYLRARGLRFLARNKRYCDGELDLVMRDDATLVFIEVRFRADDGFGGAAASITPTKRRRLVRAASRFLAAHPQWAALPARFDVVAASGDIAAPALEWLRDAFRADD
ncbi:YraN family protein [Solilutibacter pythonis]|uniref:YraN family protein n=1 Tax=Solilutibacter pythonis TaxID=2483112 RepID=UPI00319E0741